MDRFELAWAAGFFDGEGWAGAVRHGRGDRRRPQARVNQAHTHGVPQVLVRFQNALGGLGRIRGPQLQEGRKDLYRWEVSSHGDVELLHHLLAPWLGQVKLDEFAIALGRAPARSRRVSSSGEAWLPWCAGFFDGEGWASMWAHRTHEGYLAHELGVGQSGADGTPEVLTRFASIVGVGRIYGPYAQAGATTPVYKFKTSAQRDIEVVGAALMPWLSEVKRSDVRLVLDIMAGQPPLPRGNPAWGNRKTRCVRGHEYASARIRPFRPRKGGTQRRDSAQCLVCVREDARERRQKKGSAADDDRRSIQEPLSRYLLK